MTLSRVSSVTLAAVLQDCSVCLDLLGHKLKIRDAEESTMLLQLRKYHPSISQQILELHSELLEKQSFRSLQQVVEEDELRKEAARRKREENTELEQRLLNIKELKEENKQKDEELKQLCKIANGLKHQINEKSVKIKEKKKNLEIITKLQLERTQKEISHNEKMLEMQLELLQKQFSLEERRHEEYMVFLQNQNEKYQEKLQHWQNHTKQMKKGKELELNDVKCKRTVLLDKYEEKNRVFKEMEMVVLEFREKEEKLKQHEAEVKAATKLQAWWRNCMLRRGFGSFKKAEEGKKGKKNKEAKKKKK